MCRYIQKHKFIISFFIIFPINVTVTFYTSVYFHENFSIQFGDFLISSIIIYLNFIYLFICFICDISFCCTTKLRKLNNYTRNTLCHILNPLSYFRTIVAYFDSYYKNKFYHEDEIKFFCSFFSSIIVILDLFISNHKKHKFSSKTISIISLFLIVLEFFYLITNHGYKYYEPPFSFLKNISFWSYIGLCFLSLVIIIPCYLLNIFIIAYKYKVFLEIQDDFNENDENIELQI